MDKAKLLLSELKELNTNDPAMQRRVVALLEELLLVIDRQDKRIDELERNSCL